MEPTASHQGSSADAVADAIERNLIQEADLATETDAKATLHQRAMHEVKEFAILAVYLYITLGSVVLMKTAVLHTEGIEFAPWGIAIVKAAVLAKFMLLG